MSLTGKHTVGQSLSCLSQLVVRK